MHSKAKQYTATSFRQNLFEALNLVLKSLPVIIRYRNQEIRLESTSAPKNNKSGKTPQKESKLGCTPLISGKIKRSLGLAADKALRKYMRIK